VLYGEMAGYIRTDTGQYQNSASDEESEHDDTVMAFGLAVIGTVHEADSDDRPTPTVVRKASDLPAETRRAATEMEATIQPVATVVTDDDGEERIHLPVDRRRDRRAYTDEDEHASYYESDYD